MNRQEYILSENGYKCLGKCYNANEPVIHPITGRIIYKNYDFCPILGKKVTNVSINQMEFTDKCIVNNDAKEIFDPSIFLSPSEFNYKIFLEILNIKSFDEGMLWLEKKKHVNIVTRMRVLKCLLNVYWNEFNFMNNIFIIFFIEMINKKLILDIYYEVGKYMDIDIDTKKIIITQENNKLEEHKVEKINFIIDNFCENKFIKKFLVKYAEKYTDNWKNIDNHIDQLKNELIKAIKKTILHND